MSNFKDKGMQMVNKHTHVQFYLKRHWKKWDVIFIDLTGED